VRDVVKIPLVANGDVLLRVDAEELLRRSGADAVMVGRGSYGQPWLAGAIAGSDFAPRSSEDVLSYIIRHYEDMLDHYGSKTGIRHARKHLGWYLDRHVDAVSSSPEKSKKAKAEIMTLIDPEAVIAALARIFLHDENHADAIRKVA